MTNIRCSTLVIGVLLFFNKMQIVIMMGGLV